MKLRAWPILEVAVLCLIAPPALRSEEFSQLSHYSVRLFSFGTLVVDTRMGDIRIEGWDEPRVEIEAEKVVRAGDESQSKPLYKLIQVRIEGADKVVRLKTVYPPRRLWRPFRGESKLSVNYRIKMPYDANLQLKCVDGDVSIEGIVGQQQIRVNYGDVEVNVPSVYDLRSLRAHTWLGYVESDLHGEDSAGVGQRINFWNPSGKQDIDVRVRMGGVYVYSNLQ